MKPLFNRSCLGLLALIMLGCIVILLVFTVVFQQSQAVLSNATATQTARASQIYALPKPYPSATAVSPMPSDQSADMVTIQVQSDSPTAMAPTMPTFPTLASVVQISPAAAVILPPASTPIDAPRNSGTSTYPLTVTAEVMFAQTTVAHYQSGVAATRTAIAAESQSIYATLTAGVPISTEVHR